MFDKILAKASYVYIFSLSLWTLLTGGFVHYFYQYLSSQQDAKAIDRLCQLLLDNMFNVNNIFAFITLAVAVKIFEQKRHIIYLPIAYLAYLSATVINIWILNDQFIAYQ